MRALGRAIRDRLLADADFTAALAGYRGGATGGVFTQKIVPPTALLPYVHVKPQAVETPWDTFTRAGREVQKDVAVYAETGGPGEEAADDLADRIRSVFHGRPFPVPGWHCATVTAIGPADVPDEVGYAALIVTLRVRLQEGD